ncbi:rho GDP-dissociation inhibitor [Stereum hirsutum FP-91666 SS1]|uniref:rho GDP-dissociation inhibitor n=1 Tax=Stereum hirsutum (strain FP-91666) TaxID=721885 RepID=UPI000440A360|nr:rho GDP-dissociation inhibitor [Stereum hirsutum FP-91666 SS1]EIM88538.1 rho GDP-dissociation inhibitor [Stereum hirsutum FP-91666 SS1]
MSSQDDADDFAPNTTPGYKPTAAKSVDEYAKMDANDESLARWKASLGITGEGGGDPTKRKVEVLTLELTSPSLPAGRTISVDLNNPNQLAEMKDSPIQVKEGAEYSCHIKFKVNHSLVTGLRYIQVVKRGMVKVDKVDAMLGSYGYQADVRTASVVQDEFPSGMLARGTYNVKSRVTDIDGEVWAEWEWLFKIGKEW